MHFAGGAFLQVLLQLVDFRALAPDNDSRTRRLNNDPQLVARTLDFDRTHARRLELVFQFSLEPVVLEQQLVVVLLDKPARLPRLGVAEAESVRMNLLSHRCSCFPVLLCLACSCGDGPLACPTGQSPVTT